MSVAEDWERLPATTRNAVERRTGPVVKAETVSSGRNHHLAVILHTGDAPVFVKGVRTGDQRARRQTLEAAVAPVVACVAPAVLWHLPNADGWDLLGFQAIHASHSADITPGGHDLPAVTAALRVLYRTGAPPPGLVTDRIDRRWAEHGTDAQLLLLRGDHLLHTDLRPDNILIGDGRAWVVDWSWPTLGAAWVDPACLALWMIALGRQPAEAQAWLRTVPAATTVPDAALDAFAAINARLWGTIAGDDPQPWKQRLANAADEWNRHRRRARSSRTLYSFTLPSGGASPG